MMRNSVCLLLLVVVTVNAANKLKQLHVITRHGSRYPLSKNANNLSEVSKDRLTPPGERQHYDLGVWLRTRYANVTDLFVRYIPEKVRLDSSSTDRTLVSANSLALGLFTARARDPANETKLPASVSFRPNVPVYSTEPKNDVVIRAYDKCAIYDANLKALYSSSDWKALQQQYSPLLTRLAEIPEFAQYKSNVTNSIPVEQVWNVFDLVTVAKTECGNNATSSFTCRNVPNVQNVLSDTEWSQLQAVANQAELLKYGQATAGTLLGGNLLQLITKRMLANTTSTTSTTSFNTMGGGNFFLYSAHYPTILGVFAALDEAPVEARVPPYATALIFELYEGSSSDSTGAAGEDYVAIIYKPGDSNNATQLKRLCSGSLDCNITHVVNSVNSAIGNQSWCEQCSNVDADLCLTSSNNSATSSNNTSSSTGWKNNPAALTGAGAIGVVVGLLGALLLHWRQVQQRKKSSSFYPTTADAEDPLALEPPSNPDTKEALA